MTFAYVAFLCGIRLAETTFPLYTFRAYDVRLPLFVFFSRLTFSACCIVLIQYGLHLITNNYYLPLFFTLVSLLISYFTDFNHLNYYHIYGYLYSARNEFMTYGTGYHWESFPWMIIPPVIITGWCFARSIFRLPEKLHF